MFIDDPYYAGQKIKFWIYFTNWGLILLNTRLFMGALFLTEASKLQLFFQNKITFLHLKWCIINRKMNDM